MNTYSTFRNTGYATVIVAALAGQAGLAWPPALLAGIAACLAVYGLNGLIVGRIGLDPLIVTLAAWIWVRGLAVSLTDATTIAFDMNFVTLMNTPIVAGFTVTPILVLLAFVAGWLALRRTAERVDAEMQEYMRDHAVPQTWPVAERVLVCVSSSPLSAQIVRAGRRLATRLGAEWIAAYVETPAAARLPQAFPINARSSRRRGKYVPSRVIPIMRTRTLDNARRRCQRCGRPPASPVLHPASCGWLVCGCWWWVWSRARGPSPRPRHWRTRSWALRARRSARRRECRATSAACRTSSRSDRARASAGPPRRRFDA